MDSSIKWTSNSIAKIPTDISFKFSDLSGEDGGISAHKFVLAMASDVFMNMFYPNNTVDKSVSEVAIEDTTKPVFRVMIDDIYGIRPIKESLADKSLHEVFSVLRLVKKYNLSNLMLAAKERVSAFQITEDSVLEIAHEAFEFSTSCKDESQNLVRECVNFLKNELNLESFLRVFADNGDKLATVHKLSVLFSGPPMEMGGPPPPISCPPPGMMSGPPPGMMSGPPPGMMSGPPPGMGIPPPNLGLPPPQDGPPVPPQAMSGPPPGMDMASSPGMPMPPPPMQHLVMPPPSSPNRGPPSTEVMPPFPGGPPEPPLASSQPRLNVQFGPPSTEGMPPFPGGPPEPPLSSQPRLNVQFGPPKAHPAGAPPLDTQLSKLKLMLKLKKSKEAEKKRIKEARLKEAEERKAKEEEGRLAKIAHQEELKNRETAEQERKMRGREEEKRREKERNKEEERRLQNDLKKREAERIARELNRIARELNRIKMREAEKEKEKNELNSTYTKPADTTLNQTKDAGPSSYDMTTPRDGGDHPPEPLENENNYGLDDLDSEGSTDNEDAPRKEVPKWAEGALLRTALLKQSYMCPDLDGLFDTMGMPDLSEMFAHQRKRFHKRTSSAQWDAPPSSFKLGNTWNDEDYIKMWEKL